MNEDKLKASPLATSLLAWYDRSGRDLPWRVKGRAHHSPYHVWLSEIMLQQTTVATVKTYFHKFVEAWPALEDFAAAPLDDILHAWQGLGYYARARNMAKCAQTIIREYGGKFPQTAIELQKLPGIGPYTAAAIASISFEDSITPVDGNVIRVLSRVFAVTIPIPQNLKMITVLAKQLTPPQRTGDFAQALMDLGATICVPRTPKCLLCPWQAYCRGFQQGIAEVLPYKLPKPEKPLRHAVAFMIANDQGAFLFRKRPETGLLGGMVEVPTTPWRAEPWEIQEAKLLSPMPCEWNIEIRKASHSFTHFNFDISIIHGKPLNSSSFIIDEKEANTFWVKPEEYSKLALPTVMKKILKA